MTSRINTKDITLTARALAGARVVGDFGTYLFLKSAKLYDSTFGKVTNFLDSVSLEIEDIKSSSEFLQKTIRARMQYNLGIVAKNQKQIDSSYEGLVRLSSQYFEPRTAKAV